VKAFEDAGFPDVQILERDDKPWRVVNGIKFRSVTVAAYKGKRRHDRVTSSRGNGCGTDCC
jgi:hypothetical protein